MREIATVPRVSEPEKLIVNIWKNPDGTLFTRSVEIVDKISRVRFSFNADSILEMVFNSDAAKAFREIVDKTIERRGMLMMPDHSIHLSDLFIQGCRVMVTATESGIENIMIRFVRFYGRVLSLFSETFSHKDCIAEGATEQAATALENVYLPLRNFSTYLDQILAEGPESLDDTKANFLKTVRGEIQKLSYYGDMIAWYVSTKSMMQEPYDPQSIEPVRNDRLIET